MDNRFQGLPFGPADILLPQNCDLNQWSVVACDQYTSQPEYWARVAQQVGNAPSALHLILPESCLEGPDVEQDISEINLTMARYLKEGRFAAYPDALFYVERRLDCGKVRRGLVGMVDLEQYDYEPDSDAPVRATEGTVLSRIPPRVAVRKNAPIELPHAMLLADDPEKTAIEPLAAQTGEMELVYDFDLMERGGHIRGWRLTEGLLARTAQALHALADRAAAQEGGGGALLFAVGDGNHSLATAKECYERQKRLVPPEQQETLLARYALCELVNLHDDSLEFEPIHRVVFGVEPEEILDALCRRYPDSVRGRALDPEVREKGQRLVYVHGKGEGEAVLMHTGSSLTVGALQEFLDDYLKHNPRVRADYIHGDDVARALASKPGVLAFLLPPMDKAELFPAVRREGSLPRKTFSMGEAHDKRFYLEARKIR